MLISMQVACGCTLDPNNDDADASPCDGITAWDGDYVGGFVQGRRYLWRCQRCKNTICVNLTLPEVEE